MVARLLANMKPPVETPAPQGGQGEPYPLEVPGHAEAPPVRYLVQLPPEYDPHRRYPAIVALHGAGRRPELRSTGGPARSIRRAGAGQASRHGYIVIAPAWAGEQQKQYQYSAREHAAVLDSLRDACRRFSIDTDRVFLSGPLDGRRRGLGHRPGPSRPLGGSDSHRRPIRPLLPVSYWENAALRAALLRRRRVGRRQDGQQRPRLGPLRRPTTTTSRWSSTCGRGHDHFSDEILRLFDWMGRLRRNFFPKEFNTVTMRPWDNCFWWVELDQLPPQAMTDPSEWEPQRSRPRAPAQGLGDPDERDPRPGRRRRPVTIWLSPDLLDLDRRDRRDRQRPPPRRQPVRGRPRPGDPARRRAHAAATASIPSGPRSSGQAGRRPKENRATACAPLQGWNHISYQRPSVSNCRQLVPASSSLSVALKVEHVIEDRRSVSSAGRYQRYCRSYLPLANGFMPCCKCCTELKR